MAMLTELLDDLLSAVRSVTDLQEARVGQLDCNSAVPRAELLLTDVEQLRESADAPAWRRLRLTVRLHARADRAEQAARRLLNLAEAVGQALLADPFRGERCADGPFGEATEVVRQVPCANAVRPEARLDLEVRCHWRVAAETASTDSSGGEEPTPAEARRCTLDGDDLFGPGPCRLTPGSWQRQTQRRGFAGLDGEMLIDLGLRGRVIRHVGYLQRESIAELLGAIAEIESRIDGRLHTLVGPTGQRFEGIVVEGFEVTGPVQTVPVAACDVLVTYRQLP